MLEGRIRSGDDAERLGAGSPPPSVPAGRLGLVRRPTVAGVETSCEGAN
ncbi:hypothetical protein BV133_2922 [Blastochloris viridis]|uniref:Uncharacterized protein n=1 Tax=Blastochloris viridis TaxID=1079 RepID=A0A182D511_BLAVI|nr:hypothetical protein BV133_2922 [Blastochloris viridis]